MARPSISANPPCTSTLIRFSETRKCRFAGFSPLNGATTWLVRGAGRAPGSRICRAGPRARAARATCMANRRTQVQILSGPPTYPGSVSPILSPTPTRSGAAIRQARRVRSFTRPRPSTGAEPAASSNAPAPSSRVSPRCSDLGRRCAAGYWLNLAARTSASCQPPHRCLTVARLGRIPLLEALARSYSAAVGGCPSSRSTSRIASTQCSRVNSRCPAIGDGGLHSRPARCSAARQLPNRIAGV